MKKTSAIALVLVTAAGGSAAYLSIQTGSKTVRMTRQTAGQGDAEGYISSTGASFVSGRDPARRRMGAATTGYGFSRIAHRSNPESAGRASASGEGFRFEAFTIFPIEQGLAKSVAIGDVTGDGKQDVVLTTMRTGYPDDRKVFVYRQDASGGLAAPIKFEYASYSETAGLALGDMNNDGVKDIIVGHDQGITIALGGAQVFTPALIPLPERMIDLGVMDIDRDGNLDVIGQSWEHGATLVYGNGQGGMRESAELATEAMGYNDLKIGDVTGDGFEDLVISEGQWLNRLWVFAHDGVKGFKPPQVYDYSRPYVRHAGLAIGDFNADGLNDVALSEPLNTPTYIKIIHQGTTGMLSPVPVMMASYETPEPLVAVDLDRNGLMDLVTMHPGWSAIGYYLQTASGMSSEVLMPLPENVTTHYESSGLAAGDINSDGCPDIAGADYGDGLRVIYGTGCSLPRPRVTGGPLAPRVKRP